MIARKYRFHGHNALNFVYKQGRTVRSPMVLLRYAPNPRYEYCRVAVVVSKKVSKSAVSRNRMRRRIYALLEARVGEWPSYDLVLTVLDPRIATISEKNINNIIFDKLQILSLMAQPVDK